MKTLFLATDALAPNGVLARRVFPSLASLAADGFAFVLIAAGEVASLVDLLTSQGIAFADVKTAPELIRSLLMGAALDRKTSAVVGDAAFAAAVGLPVVRLGSGFGWPDAVEMLVDRPRRGRSERRTKETRLRIEVDLDAPHAEARIATGIGFFDHMLDQLGRHAGFSLTVEAEGDLSVDEHHTVEDTALALGQALGQALGDRRGIERYGFVLPMDEARATVALDLSGRPHLTFKGEFRREAVGGLPTELVPHFFQSLAQALGATLHIEVEGVNEHHMIEAAFKGVARTLRQAVRRSGETGVPSTKGSL